MFRIRSLLRETISRGLFEIERGRGVTREVALGLECLQTAQS
jgi:hypothetical protein